MTKPFRILGIESSCDDTGVAVLAIAPDAPAEIVANVVVGQTDLHKSYGGVVPEIAARAHAERLQDCATNALDTAELTLADIDAIAVTAGPGLIGGVVSGVMFAKGIAAARNLPLIGVNHLAGHALTPRLTDQARFPYLMLLVSGGHCQFLIVRGPDDFTRLGGTIDDAPGEAFDKTARVIGLDQPGGPMIERAASGGDPGSVPLPRPLLDRPGCDMSFSGLKTAVKRVVDAEIAEKQALTQTFQADLAASFQQAVTDILTEKSRRAIQAYLQSGPDAPCFAVAGGVAANQQICGSLRALCDQMGLTFLAPPLALCTDNAAMIAWAGYELYQTGQRDGLDLSARPRWPLDKTATAMLGSGKKGAKA